ncbi:MAG: type II toxin-antitoxin system HicA family toxin [Bacteroidetes bacterium]|nr:type II toxin-antitoxin system HicA family toxin [Bacteroidota bacterium]MBL7104046.1 type II toxin-antitoxin system HicA family toxin [Bacteroidales bacterium]
MEKQKLLDKILKGSKNIHFNDFVNLVEIYGFKLSRTKGSHHIYIHKHVDELINLQNVKGKAKPYQVRQFLKLIEKYNINMED